MTAIYDPVTLTGESCTLVPLTYHHHDDLVEAVKDGELWQLWYTFAPEPTKVHEQIARRLQLYKDGTMLPFSVINNETSKVVGMTTFMNIDKMNHRVEIGGTWYAKSQQRTSLNTECKLLLLTHAFEYFNSIAVEFRTHALNFQSRAGIERLGAKLDGVLRNHSRAPNGTLRDTYVYSIINSEWPTIKTHLHYLKCKYSGKK